MTSGNFITEEDRQALWFEFTKAIMHKRILLDGNKVEKFEVFATFLSKCNRGEEVADLISLLLIDRLPRYELVWKWELLGYKDQVPPGMKP